MRSVPKPTGRFRVRRWLFGKAILQREYCEDGMFMAWDDVDFDSACPVLLREIAEGKE